ncbi:MAG: sigma-70 family RNA polymerase sigma factor [Eubacterium sp.]|nr:sigma-70 family RNA polymerase sigma factor [Eubacterium sp.]
MENYLEQIRLAKQGDTKAFAGLYQEIYEDLYRFALYTLKNPADAQDAVSDTVMDAFISIRRLRAEEAFRGWIFRILSNKCKRKLREYANRPAEWSEEFADRLVSRDSGDAAEYLQVRILFWKLPAKDRMIIAMHLFAGYTSREIAKLLHMNENTVRSRESRALRKMREQWDAKEIQHDSNEIET